MGERMLGPVLFMLSKFFSSSPQLPIGSHQRYWLSILAVSLSVQNHMYVGSLSVISLIRVVNKIWYLNKTADFGCSSKAGQKLLHQHYSHKQQYYEPGAYHKLIFINSVQMPVFNGWALFYQNIPQFWLQAVISPKFYFMYLWKSHRG